MLDIWTVSARLKNKRSDLYCAQARTVRLLYEKLGELPDERLLKMWRRELRYCYGDLGSALTQNEKIRAPKLLARFGFDEDTPLEVSRLLMSIQSSYSVIVKLIAYEALCQARGEEPKRGEKDFFSSVLGGEAFKELGAGNLCYADWFSWLVKYPDADISAECAALYELLIACGGGALPCRGSADCLKEIYETIMPRELRHALGEYYTPHALAKRVLQNALAEESGEKLRICDPTCGAGTFLAAARELKPSSTLCGFDINALAVLTAKAGLLLSQLSELSRSGSIHIPVYHFDVLHPPTERDGYIEIDTGCGLCCRLTKSDFESFKSRPEEYDAKRMLPLLSGDEAFAALDGADAEIIANIVLNRLWSVLQPKADIAAGNPPWVNWEYLPAEYKSSSEHLWSEYGLFAAKGREKSFAKEDISSLITYVTADRLLKDGGLLSFVLPQSVFKSAQNGAGFRCFYMESARTPLRVLRVDDLGTAKPFSGAQGRTALVLIKKGEAQRYPVPYYLWSGTGLKAGEVPEPKDMEKLQAVPSDSADALSPWLTAGSELSAVFERVLGESSYRARTGVFTGGANAVYWLDIRDEKDGLLRVSNLVGRAKRKAEAVQAELESDYVYPLVQGSDLSKWHAESRAYILCPHTAETRLRPVCEETLKSNAPRTYEYLRSFRAELDGRRGFAGWEKDIQKEQFYAVLRVGNYTFAKYKVAWRYIASSFITAVISTRSDPFLGERLCLPNEKLMYVGLADEDEAYYLCGVLSSSPVALCVRHYMNPTSISAHVLGKLRIPDFDRENETHMEISRLCRAGHETREREALAGIQRELDAAAGRLYGLDKAQQELIEKERDK